MKKLITVLFGCALVFGLANCALTPLGVIKKRIQLMKLAFNEKQLEEFNAELDSGVNVLEDAAKKIEVCDADDLKILDARLDCMMSAIEAAKKAKSAENSEALKAAEEIFDKCDEVKAKPACETAFEDAFKKAE